MENIDKNFYEVKEDISLNSHIYDLCVLAEIISKGERGGNLEIKNAEHLVSRL